MIILAYKYGQLGNRLSYLKDFFALALEFEFSVLVLTFDEYADYFCGTNGGIVCSFPKQFGQSVGKNLLSKFLRQILQIIGRIVNGLGYKKALYFPEPDTNGCHVFSGNGADMLKNKFVCFLSGWPCVPADIIEKHSEKIRNYFSLVDEHASRVKQTIDAANALGDFLVGIHIRQGDYRTWHNGVYYYETTVYLDLMRRVTQKHAGRHVVFIVCSDEEQNWALFENFSFVTGPGDAVGDMYSLAGCDEIYGPQSSFSAWASFYGKVPLFGIQAFNSDVSGHNQ